MARERLLKQLGSSLRKADPSRCWRTILGHGERPCFVKARIAERGTQALRFRPRHLGPLGNHLAFMIGNGGESVNGQARGLPLSISVYSANELALLAKMPCNGGALLIQA